MIDDDEKNMVEENFIAGGRRIQSGAPLQGFFKSELKLDFCHSKLNLCPSKLDFCHSLLDFCQCSKVLHSGTQPEMLDIRLNGESVCSTVGGCGGGRI